MLEGTEGAPELEGAEPHPAHWTRLSLPEPLRHPTTGAPLPHLPVPPATLFEAEVQPGGLRVRPAAWPRLLELLTQVRRWRDILRGSAAPMLVAFAREESQRMLDAFLAEDQLESAPGDVPWVDTVASPGAPGLFWTSREVLHASVGDRVWRLDLSDGSWSAGPALDGGQLVAVSGTTVLACGAMGEPITRGGRWSAPLLAWSGEQTRCYGSGRATTPTRPLSPGPWTLTPDGAFALTQTASHGLDAIVRLSDGRIVGDAEALDPGPPEAFEPPDAVTRSFEDTRDFEEWRASRRWASAAPCAVLPANGVWRIFVQGTVYRGARPTVCLLDPVDAAGWCPMGERLATLHDDHLVIRDVLGRPLDAHRLPLGTQSVAPSTP